MIPRCFYRDSSRASFWDFSEVFFFQKLLRMLSDSFWNFPEVHPKVFCEITESGEFSKCSFWNSYSNSFKSFYEFCSSLKYSATFSSKSYRMAFTIYFRSLTWNFSDVPTAVPFETFQEITGILPKIPPGIFIFG